jgi:hypothetical protein
VFLSLTPKRTQVGLFRFDGGDGLLPRNPPK